MALPLKTMYDTFKDEIWKALGPLDPDWFEVLTAQTSANEASGSDQDELCANQEGHFKTPLDKTALGSQPFSTPKVFRHSRIVSPETEDEQSFTAAQEKDKLPWTETQSPYLFRMSKQGVPGTKYGESQPQSQHNFDLLDALHKSPIIYDKRISESLGAQMNPDISWTSSFNTPPPVPSTLILSKTDESPCPASVSVDKSVVFVRKLFPSLSNASRVGLPPAINNDIPIDNYGAVLPEAVSPHTSFTQNGVWKKTLPDARADGETRNTVAGVADEPENISSAFLANSSSALRNVKPDRDISTTNTSNEEGKADEELGDVPSSSPVKPGSTGISQWSPLSLSQIPPCTADSNIVTELQTDSDSRQLIRPPLKITDSGFIRKKRKFIYTVETLKPQVQENETDFQKMDTSPGVPNSGPELSSKQSADTTDDTGCCTTVKNAEQTRENLVLENLPPSVQEKVQDLDMSQLHRDFAQDFTQMPDSGELGKVVAEDQNYFSPSACLLAMKQDKHKRRQANLHHDYNGISNAGQVSTTSPNYSISEGTASDSGFQSAVADITHTASSCVVPCLESTGSKADIRRTTPFPSTHKANGRSQLKERPTLNSERESQLDTESTLTQLPSSPAGTVDGRNCITLNGKVRGILPEKTAVPAPPVHASGFKTASNKGIQISLANLEKARHLFEESESEGTLCGQPTNCNRADKQKNSLNSRSVSVSNQQTSLSERFEGVSCHLTASQKADVTELCVLLEEAESQFEFTQFKTAEVKQPCPESACSPENAKDKDLDPDFLAGIDFDDSFSSDAEKHLAVAVMPDKMTCVLEEKSKGGASSITSKSANVLMSSAVKKENISAGDVLPSSENNPGRSKCLMSTKPESFHRAEHTEPSKMEKQNPLMLDVAFKTAAGNALRVSNTCLSKARALFADLEINVSDPNPSDKQAAETDEKSEKMCSEHPKTDDLKFTLKNSCQVEERSFSNSTQTDSAFKQVTSIQDKYATRGVEDGKMDAINIVHKKCENVNTGLGGPQPDGVKRNGAGVLDLKTPASFHESPVSTSKLLPCSASKITDSVTISDLSSGDGFRTASGKKNKESPPKTSGLQRARGKGVSISSTAHNKAEYLLSKCDKVDDKIVVKPPHYKVPVHGPPPSNSGFLAASGKKITLSSDALQKAKALFSDISFSAGIPVIPHTRNSDNADKMQNGFTAAGGKGHVSEKTTLKDFEDSNLTKTMQEAEDCDMNVNNDMSVKLESLEPVRGSGSELEIRPDQRVTPNISVTSANKQVKQKDNLPLQSGGFSTASGKKVSISSDALKKAKSLLGECDIVDDKIKSHLNSPVGGPLPKSGGFRAASGKPVALSPVALQKAKDLFSDIILDAESPVVPYPKNSDKNHENWENPGKMQCGFQTAGGKKVHVSQKNLLKGKHLLEDFDDSVLIKAVQEAEDCDMDFNGMSVKNKSAAPMSERLGEKKNLPETRPEQNAPLSISVESGNGCTEDTEKHVEQQQNNLPLRSGGFQTASGKKVSISSDALKKAKSLLGECEIVDDKIKSHLKTPVGGPLPKSGGFRAASGKPVALSPVALQKAKDLFSDIILDAESPVISYPKNSDKNHENWENPGKMQCGFQTAGGKKVHVSQKNLLKGKHLLEDFDDSVLIKAVQEAEDCDIYFNGMSEKNKSEAPVSERLSEKKNLPETRPEQNAPLSISVESGNGCTEDTEKHVEQQQDTFPLRSGGFSTASGKKVSISSDALKKAKSLLGECEIVDDKIKSHLKTPVGGPLPKSGGFQTASGKGVAISSEALGKAKSLLAECDEADDKVGVKPSCLKIPVHCSLRKDCGFRAASGKPVAVSPEALQRGKAFFSDIPFSAEIPHGKKSHKKYYSGENAGEMQSGFQTAEEAQVQVPQNNRVKAKHLLKEFDDLVSTKAIQEADCDMNVNCGVSVKHDNIAPVGDISKDSKNGFTEVTNERWRQNNSLQQQSGGFQTASGKEVIVSSEALKSAKTLLSECEGVDKTSSAPPHSKISVHGPPFRSGGFLAASGKPVALSSEAMQKAKELFSDGLSTYTPAAVHPRKSDKKTDAHSREKIHYGFTTAGGVEVHVSENSLLKATSLFKEFGDAACHDSLLFSSSPHTLNQSKVKDVEGTSGSNFARVCDKDSPAKGSASLVVKSVPSLLLSSPDHESETFENSSGRGCSSVINRAPKDTVTPSGAGTVHDCPEEEMPCMLNCEMNNVSSTKESKVLKADVSSVLNFQSLDLAGCSATQQKFLAQEALDCTKALLEDEGLADQSLLMILENVPLQHNTKSNRSEEGEKIRGKRSAEDPEMTGQPPLKRRLLEEFDRTLVEPRASGLHPVKSCPNGLMKDRGVFKHSTSLYPNITRPLSNGRNFVEPSFQKTAQTKNSNRGDGRSAHYKTPAFVPPFVRNAKAETPKNTVLKDNTRTPLAFVPPFKKQRTTVQKSPSKPREGENKHQKPLLFNSNGFVPPTKKTHGTADVTGLAAAPTDDVNNQSLPADCGPVGAVEETSGVDVICSRSRGAYQNLENIEMARDMQDMRIRKKKRQKIRPLPGSSFLTKTSGVARIPLKAAVNGKTPGRYTQNQLYAYGVQKHVSHITSDNAEAFRFSLLRFINQEAFTDGGGVQLADGGWLVPSNDGTAGKEEFYRALCDTPGVDPKLISDAWVYNHYRWIVWKQASMEKSFPEMVGSRCLTPEQVLLQLKYRYDVEVDHSRRPALRKIMEKDDTAVKTLVLCVCGIISRGHSPKRESHSDTKTPHGADAKVESPAALVWLTDGWYAIKAQLDEPLIAMVHKGRLAVGGKLIINGAQLVGSQDACSPLEAPESLMLKVCANSCRPARWDAKLGFHKDPRPFLLPVSSLHSNGGPIGCVDIVILRSYPIQWMERKPDGGVVFRSSRAEEKEARRYNSQKQKAMELLFAKIQAEFENEERGRIDPQRRRKTISHQEVARLQDGEELHDAVGDDPAHLEAHLSAHQLEALHTYRRSMMEKKRAELQDRYRGALEAEDNQMNCPKREVTPVWRLCIADSTEQPGRVYQLNLWRPSSDLQDLLKEGCRYKVYNLTASEAKKRSCTEAVQLTGTKKTQFQELQASQEWLSSYFHPRVSTDFVNLQDPDFQPLCGEVDLTGYVIRVIDGQGSSPAFYLADEKLNFVKVRCFSSLSQSGLENMVKPHVILALSNLQLRGQSMHPTPVVYAGDLTSFSTNPKEGHLQGSLRQLKTLVQCQENFFVNAEVTLSHLVTSNGLSSGSSPALQRDTPASTTDRRPDTKTIAISQKPVRSLGSFTPVGRNSPAPTSSAENDPKSLKRRRALDYLSRIPSPPALSHLASGASPYVRKTFNPPRRSATPSTLKAVQTPSHKPTESLGEEGWVNDEELAMIDTQALCVNLM